jgi:hypothetical protein
MSSEVETSRENTFKAVQRDSSTLLGMTKNRAHPDALRRGPLLPARTARPDLQNRRALSPESRSAIAGGER